MNQTPGTKYILNEEMAGFGAVLLRLYLRGSIVILPIIVIYQTIGFLGILKIDHFQIAIGIISFVFCSFICLFRKQKWLVTALPYIHWFMLLSLTIISFVWVVSRADAYSALGLLLMLFLCGLVVVRPVPTILYYCAAVATTLVLGRLYAIPLLDVKFAFYILFSGSLITVFAYWRDHLARISRSVATTYRNLFSDLSEQIYVLNDDLTILELNKTAADYLKKQFNEPVIGKNFNDVFCSQDEKDQKKFRESLKDAQRGIKTSIEVKCGLMGADEHFPKEITMRKSSFFENDALILTVRSLKDQREYEQRIVESKENISRVLENINSFIFNISYHPNGHHQINYVSNKVKDVYGIETDEYITLIKSGRLSDIFYHEDRQEAVQLFEEVISTVRENRIKFRIVRNNEIRWVEEKIFPKKIDDEDTIQLFGIVTDITDQVGSTIQLQNSEKRYRQMFERNLAGVYKTHIDGTILDANPSFARILGYDSIEELKTKNIRELYYEQNDRKGYLDRLKREGFLNNYISRLRRKDGKRLILNNNVTLQPDEDGNLNVIEGTLIDITEIEETSNALKLSEEKYRLLFEESREGILLLSMNDGKAVVIDQNAGASDILGFTPTELRQLTLPDFAVNAEKLQEKFMNYSPESKKTEKLYEEWKFKRADKTEFDAEISFVTIHLHDETIIQLVIKDISERKRNEEILRESQRSFKNIVDNSPAAILIFSQHKLVYMNPVGEKLYHERLNHHSKRLEEIFPEKHKYILNDLVHEKANSLNTFTEFELGTGNDIRQYSINSVKTVYNTKKSDLFMLQDITLQTEYNRQKLRAEIAEDANKKLQDEIARHKITQAELLEKTFWLNALFESSYNLFILSLDENYCLSSFNENFRKMIRASLGKEIKTGDNFLDIFNSTGQARKNIESRFARVLNGETLEFISHYPSKRGEIWVESFLNPVKISGRDVAEISFISHEITEKIEAQKKIKESEANNRAILLALPDILTKVNKDGVFTDFRMSSTDGLKLVLPYIKTTEPVGKHIHDVIKDKSMAEKFLENVHRVLETNELLTDTVELFRDPQLRPLYYENRFSKMSDNEVVVLSRNVTETIEYESMLVEAVKEKEVLLKEVHHRVKNNLQVINSILNLQSSYVEDPKTLEIINESQNRIRSMSYIHESLYQTKDFSSINFADYITNLVQNLVHSYQIFQDKIDLRLNVQSVKLALDQAIPCGLILNELVSNALKYAYPGKQKGQIVIEVSEENNRLTLGVEDFGVGLPENFKMENTESLGLSLVHTLVDQLDGELKLKRLGGTKFLITFEKQEV